MKITTLGDLLVASNLFILGPLALIISIIIYLKRYKKLEKHSFMLLISYIIISLVLLYIAMIDFKEVFFQQWKYLAGGIRPIPTFFFYIFGWIPFISVNNFIKYKKSKEISKRLGLLNILGLIFSLIIMSIFGIILYSILELFW